MSIDKDTLKRIGRFHMADPEEFVNMTDWAEWLESILHNPCSVWEKEDGELVLLEIKQLVERVDGLKMEIYPNEHPPPHFHVKSPNINASFRIEDCVRINGDISGSDEKKVLYWHKHAKPMLISVWNETRPTNCVVGLYAGT